MLREIDQWIEPDNSARFESLSNLISAIASQASLSATEFALSSVSTRINYEVANAVTLGNQMNMRAVSQTISRP